MGINLPDDSSLLSGEDGLGRTVSINTACDPEALPPVNPRQPADAGLLPGGDMPGGDVAPPAGPMQSPFAS